MKNLHKIILLCLSITSIAEAAAQNSKDVSLKIGGCYFLNCERTIAFGEQAVMTVNGDDKTGRMVNFDLFAPNGALEASLKNGQFTGPKAKSYKITAFPDGFTITDTRNGRVVLKIVSMKNASQARYDLHVWADFYLPNGGRFLCSPEESNVPLLQMMQGSTFKNVGTAIQLN